MNRPSLTFDAVAEDWAGPKWQARWARSWPAYEAWFIARGGDEGPDRAACAAALLRHMPELVPVWQRLTDLAGGGDRAARFLSTWCPPPYLGGCSIAAASNGSSVRLVRNYDLSPDLNEGLLLRSAWTGQHVMGMVEFLWGLSDGINARGLSVALAYGGRQNHEAGFGITTIVRYVLETCGTVAEARKVLKRVPSHMGYNLVLADAGGNTASIEMLAGGGTREMPVAVATNHQSGAMPDRAEFTATYPRHAHLSRTLKARPDPRDLAAQFQAAPLFQENYAQGFGTLFTAEYDPQAGAMTLIWQDGQWRQQLDAFEEGRREVRYGAEGAALQGWLHFAELEGCADWGAAKWIAYGQACSAAAVRLR